MEHACSPCYLRCIDHSTSGCHRTRPLWKGSGRYRCLADCLHACSRYTLDMGISRPRFVRYAVHRHRVHVLSTSSQVRWFRTSCSNYIDSSARHASSYGCSCTRATVCYGQCSSCRCSIRCCKPWLEGIRRWSCNSVPRIRRTGRTQHVPPT